MGLAGFSHDFGAMEGRKSDLGEGFEALTNLAFSFLSLTLFLMEPVMPILTRIPTDRAKTRTQLKDATGVLARQLLANVAREKESVDDKSILGLMSNLISLELVMGIAELEPCSQVSEWIHGISFDRGGSQLSGESTPFMRKICLKR
jgi:hypothetical protein